jgi:hypothetical protein
MPTTLIDHVAPVPNVNWPADLFNDVIASALEPGEATAGTEADFLWTRISRTWTGGARGRTFTRPYLRLISDQTVP